MNVILSSRLQKTTVLIAGLVVLAVVMVASILFGINRYSLTTAVEAYTQFSGSEEHLIITTSRMPRTLTAVAVGSSLAVAGVLLQALTRNPLASPSLIGVNAGAAAAIVTTIVVFGSQFPVSQMMWAGFIGAGVTALLVYGLASAGRGGMTPIKLTLSGAAVAAFASSVTSLFMLLQEKTMTEAFYWLVGSVEGRQLDHFYMIIPYLLVGWLGAMVLTGSLNLMVLGDDVATGLGQKIILVKATALLLVVLLAGGSVALAGPIAFVGIIIPHLCRFLVGLDHRWLIPYSIVFGGAFLVCADLLSRLVLMPMRLEVPVGVATAMIGVAFIIPLVRGRAYA
ncbi:iron ABC transporter [Brevibacillus brevis]|uniref:FecCD family ABC transporter permease n=1 Tax=Brevibacillus brevis TaxID=1393 RepID=UPI000B3749CF|nr:iron ABC transporter permease [Brevibacillus brevis]OUQ87496.1 iron ABC transporter [Brevibacillus brevis]